MLHLGWLKFFPRKSAANSLALCENLNLNEVCVCVYFEKSIPFELVEKVWKFVKTRFPFISFAHIFARPKAFLFIRLKFVKSRSSWPVAASNQIRLSLIRLRIPTTALPRKPKPRSVLLRQYFCNPTTLFVRIWFLCWSVPNGMLFGKSENGRHGVPLLLSAPQSEHWMISANIDKPSVPVQAKLFVLFSIQCGEVERQVASDLSLWLPLSEAWFEVEFRSKRAVLPIRRLS